MPYNNTPFISRRKMVLFFFIILNLVIPSHHAICSIEYRRGHSCFDFPFGYSYSSHTFGERQVKQTCFFQAGIDINSLIDKLQARYSKMAGLSANFTQIYVGADGQILRESGLLFLKKPGKARWEYFDPEKKIFISNGKNTFFYAYGERQATRTAIRESRDPQTPFLFLLGRGNIRKDFSSIQLDQRERPIDSSNVIIRLTPSNVTPEFSHIAVEVNPTTYQVRRMVIYQVNGSRMDFYLTNLRENYIAPDNLFIFVPPPGVSIRNSR